MEAAASPVARTADAPSARTDSQDREAVATLFERHFDGLFDFALRLTRSSSDAVTIVRGTLARNGGSAADLFVSARDLALDRLRHQRRVDRLGDDREAVDFTQIDAQRLRDPSAVIFDRTFVELVWDCAAALGRADYASLDLHVLRGLSAGVLGESEARLARLRSTFEETATATLLAARASHSCEGLATCADLRAVRRHIGICRRCHSANRHFVSPLEVFASLAPIPPAPGVRERVRKELLPQRNGWARRFRR
jgi:DNA-directed RNA polymerase specialized sigma24 family protein